MGGRACTIRGRSTALSRCGQACTGLLRKNSVKDRNRLADRKEEEATRMESRSFGQKVTVVRCMHRLTPRGNLGFYSQPFFPSLSPDEKKKKSNLQAVVCYFDPHGDYTRFPFNAWSRPPLC